MPLLHPTLKVEALTPLYVQNFACIGSDCSDNCCTGWKVTIDKKTFNAYRQTKNLKLVAQLDKHIKRTRSQESDTNYARIELNTTSGECPMMENKLCSVQAEIGEDKLSNTCFSYPRISQKVGDFNQQSLTLSCPEAARLALLSENAFDFTQSKLVVRPETIDKMTPMFGLSLDEMNEIRFYCIKIVRTEALELWQKLAILGLFCESLTKIFETRESKNIKQLIATIDALLINPESAEIFDAMHPHYSIQAVTFTLLWRLKSERSTSASQQAVHKAVALGLGADPQNGNVTETQLVERYGEGVKLLPTALEEAPFFLENYVLNEMFRECFPFSNTSPFEHYLRLVTRFGLVRFMLAAQCQPNKPLPNLAVMVQTVQAFCRRYQHDNQFAINVNDCLKNSGWNQLDKIYRFLKT